MATGRTNRLALDENNLAQAGKDVNTGKGPVFTLAAPYVLQVGHIVDGVVTSISDWVSVRLQVTSQCNKDGDRYIDQTVTSLNTGLTQEQWDGDANQHASFSLTGADTNLALLPCDNGPLYYVLTAARNDGQIVPLGTGTIRVEKAHAIGTNLVLSPLGSNYPQLAFTTAFTVGPESFSVLPNGQPNSFTLALSLPASSASVASGALADYPTLAALGVDALIAGKTASGTTQNFFSTYNNTARVYARNPSCIYPWPSWASVANTANADGTGGNRGSLMMVSPTQGVTNNHFTQIYATGTTHYFLGIDGAVYPAVISGSTQVAASDVRVVNFASALPAAVGVAQFFATGIPLSILPAGTPVISTNAQRIAYVNELASDNGIAVLIRSAQATNRLPWTRNPVISPAMGDSDQFAVVIFNNQAVLITTWHYDGNPASGPSYSGLISGINALLIGGATLKIFPVSLPDLSVSDYRPDIESVTLEDGITSLQDVAFPADNSFVEFSDSNGVLYRYQFHLGFSDATSGVNIVRDATDTGAWYLLSSFDATGTELAPSATNFPGGVYCSTVVLAPAALPASGSPGQFWSDGTHAYCRLGGTWKQLDN